MGISDMSFLGAVHSLQVYMASGLVNWDSDELPPVRWVDDWEDGQGRGHMAGACSPAFDFADGKANLLRLRWKTIFAIQQFQVHIA